MVLWTWEVRIVRAMDKQLEELEVFGGSVATVVEQLSGVLEDVTQLSIARRRRIVLSPELAQLEDRTGRPSA